MLDEIAAISTRHKSLSWLLLSLLEIFSQTSWMRSYQVKCQRMSGLETFSQLKFTVLLYLFACICKLLFSITTHYCSHCYFSHSVKKLFFFIKMKIIFHEILSHFNSFNGIFFSLSETSGQKCKINLFCWIHKIRIFLKPLHFSNGFIIMLKAFWWENFFLRKIQK